MRSQISVTAWLAHFGFVAAMSLATGCYDAPSAVVGSPRVEATTSLRSSEDGRYGGEAELAAIARDIPAFAGFVLDRNTVVVSVVDPAAGPAAVAKVRALFASSMVPSPRAAPSFVVRHAAFSYGQLAGWRDMILDSLFFKGPGMLQLDLDEAENVVYVGVDAASFPERQATLRVELTSLGIPPAAVRIAPATRSQAASGEVWASQLLASAQPFYAGLRVLASQGDGGAPCTGGLIADYAGSRTLLIASHCSRLWGQGGSDGSTFVDLYGKVLGTELLDPSVWSCGTMPCRRSDFLLASLTGPPTDYLRGAIARPAVLNSCTWGQEPVAYCNTYTDPSYPIFLVRGQNSSTYVGMPVEKVGVKTGWTSGYITRTCVVEAIHYDQGNVTLTCAQETTAYDWGGDSGGPFISRTGDDGSVTLLGITSAVNATTNRSFYTTIASFAADAGISASAINVTTNTTISGIQLTGDVSLSLSWTSAVVSGSSPYPTTYTVFRKYHQAGGDGPLVARYTSTSAGSYSDDECVAADYYFGTTIPPENVSWVAYYIAANNTFATSTTSPTVYYRVIEPPSC